VNPSPDDPRSREDKARDFAQQAAQRQAVLVRELVDFLLHNKKWWLAPLVAVLLLVGLLVILGGTGAAPFIYTLF
jgi:hypothetical protein